MGKSLQCPLYRRSGGLETFKHTKRKLLHLPGIEPRFLGGRAHSLVTTMTEIHRFVPSSVTHLGARHDNLNTTRIRLCVTWSVTTISHRMDIYVQFLTLTCNVICLWQKRTVGRSFALMLECCISKTRHR